MPVVEVNRLTKVLEEKKVLSGVSFSLQPGERLAVAGPAGAGKTTLCRLLMGMLAPTSGSARIFGHDVLRGGRICRQLTGYMPAGTALSQRLTAGEHLRQMLSFYPRASMGYAKALLDRLELNADLLPCDMTHAQARRLRLALALAVQPELLILDEPFAPGFEEAEDAFLAQALESEINERTTLILTCPHLDAPPLPLTRALLLRGGEVLAAGTLDRLRLPCRRVCISGAAPGDEALQKLRAFCVEREADGVSFFYDGAADALLLALAPLHPREVTIEHASADDVLVRSQAEGGME